MLEDELTLSRLRACMAALSNDNLHAVGAARTLSLGPWWVRFENQATLLWQLAQMAQTEGIEDDAALQAECDVYASLLPAHGCLVTLGQQVPEPHTWAGLLASLPAGLQLVCGDISLPATSLTPMGQQCQMLFSLSDDMRACFADQAAVVHCQLQTFAACLPDGLRRAL